MTVAGSEWAKGLSRSCPVAHYFRMLGLLRGCRDPVKKLRLWQVDSLEQLTFSPVNPVRGE